MQEHALRDKKKSFISELVVIWLKNVTKHNKIKHKNPCGIATLIHSSKRQ